MILPSDGGYRRAKRARQGLARLDSRFDGFVAGFQARFGVAPLWLEVDQIRRWGGGPDPRARLTVVLERSADYRAFLSAGGTFDTHLQREVAHLYAEQVAPVGPRPRFRLARRAARATARAGELFVCFADFERVAIEEAHQSVTKDEMGRFEATLGLGEQLWCTGRGFGPPIVFVHTNDQVDALRTSPLRREWADRYYELVQPHDEFGYLTATDIAITVDSKENFDNNYSSNWYYYFK